MAKKFFSALVLVFVLTGSVFSAEQFKHQRGDMYVGVNLGMGFTPSMFNVFSVSNSFPEGNYALTFDLGLSYDYYQTEWLSFNAGLMAHFGLYAFLPNAMPVKPNTGFMDIAAAPLSLTIPLSAHINIPYVSFLYAGIGLSLNIPLVSLLSSDGPEDPRQQDMSGDVFLGMPIDIGFDLMPVDSGGMRFFFRITPEFHGNVTVMPIGFIWQVFNLKIRQG